MDKYHDVKEILFNRNRMKLTIDGKKYVFRLSDISPKLIRASKHELESFEVSPSGYGIHWPLVNEDLSIDGLLHISYSHDHIQKVHHPRDWSIGLRQEDYKIAAELKQRLRKTTPLVDFRVFGSRARGQFTESSDLDVFIEVKTLDKNLKRKIRHMTWEVGLKYLIVISARIYSQEQIENSPLKTSDLISNIMSEGIQV